MLRTQIGIVLLLCLSVLGVGNAEARHPKHPGHAMQAALQDEAGKFDYYLLALSWSPTYCLAHKSDATQCGNKGFGFVLHGLWPQYAAGGYPENCQTDEPLTTAARSLGNTIFPNPDLVTHEWTTHGTCSGVDAFTYFKDADRARTSIKVPQELESPAQTLSTTAAAIASKFLAANPGMPDRSVVAACSGPELAEVRICLDRNSVPMACGNNVKSNCGSRSVRVPAVR